MTILGHHTVKSRAEPYEVASSSGRFGVRLSKLLPALAPLFGALWLFTAVPAQAQTTLLSGTLNVKNLGGNSGYGCWNGSAVVSVRCSTTATLSDDDFTYGGTDYAITAILSIAGQVRVQFDKAVPQGLRTATLNIGSFALALSNASYSSNGTILEWNGSYSQLTLNSAVSVSIVPPPSTVSLSASPNPVPEGSTVTVTATLSRALSSAVTIPLTLTAGTAESGDYGALASITVAAGAASGTGPNAADQGGAAGHANVTEAPAARARSRRTRTPTRTTRRSRWRWGHCR